jgi:hypothetical protein
MAVSISGRASASSARCLANPSASSEAAAPPLAPPFHARCADAAAASAVSAAAI